LIRVEAEQASLSIFEGIVVAVNEAGSLTLTSGQSAVAEAGKAPVLRIVARPRDAVQWALYYPPVLYMRPDAFPAGPDWQGLVRQSLELYLRGDLQSAFDSIANVPEPIRAPRFFAYRAHLLLAVGRVDEAMTDIEWALRLHPNDSNALALQTIIAIVQNDKDTALKVAQQAVGTAPDSATAQIALSYAQQARFDLEGARASLEKAVTLDPQNALAWARLAELQSSFGDLKKALNAAQKAVALEPNLARTQTVLGFAYLTQIKTHQAKDAFVKAITLDQADPLPRLGLGLAKIREGSLHEGSRDVEIAASLDPNNALIRSYLGKAYYEEKRTGLDEREYAVAKELDPKDPTPWFYDAITKQTTNQPVEALHDLQHAIELNDNRAVYRSRLLLDEDIAVRGARLGSIYRDLGFEQLALVEGWKSINLDPSNHSAHRLLADTYLVLPRHEIARDSELLQSQLLQPININPVQPRLANNGLAFLDDTAPAQVGVNEFARLFVANQLRLLADGIVGGNRTFADNLIVSGIYGTISYSVGQFHFETDGFRENNDLKQNIYSVFLQGNLSNQTSIQTELRIGQEKLGDRRLLFFSDNFSRSERRKIDTQSVRVGLRHSFTPNSTLIASFIYNEEDTKFKDAGLHISVDEDAQFFEFRYLYQWERISLTGGFGYFNGNVRELVTFDAVPQLDNKPNIRHINTYVYTNIHYPRNIILTLGTSFDSLKEIFVDREQVNPKFGVTWNLSASTTVRAAAFRAVKRTLTSSQTVEPTQVAGFNQFFDDINGTNAWRYGVALDQKIAPTLAVGVEFSRRDLRVPARDLEDLTRVKDQDETEELGRGYLYWTPLDGLTLSAGYQFERFERDPQNTRPEGFVESKTHRVPLEFRFFHPSGIFYRARATYVNQVGLFRNVTEDVVRGSDDFWIVDMSLGYRLPRRLGVVTVGVHNLFDTRFNFQDINQADLGIISPKRLILGRLTLSF
jgi:tetratricopeptide (TPR) repeat protein